MSSPHPSPAPPLGRPSAGSARPLIDGPQWYRGRIRGYGPFLALVLPGIVGAIAYLSLQMFDTAWSGAVGFVGGVFAAPGLLAVGAPFGDRDLYPLAVAASGVLWVLVGLIASRRATRHPMATWSDYWRHYTWLVAGIWAGVGAALVIATVAVGDAIV